MKCSIENPNLKTWNRVIHALSVTGDEDIHFSFTDATVTLTVFDASLAVCVTCTFFKSFFHTFNIERDTYVSFKVSAKCFLKPFRSMRFLTKCCTLCEIEHEDTSNSITITVGCKFGAEIKYTIILSADGEELRMDYDPETLKNWIETEPKLMMGSLSNFGHCKGLIDLTLKAEGNKILLKNCATELLKKEGKIYTELTLNAVDFVEFNVQEDSEVTFQLREFKTFVAFAEHMKYPMTLHFQGPLDPVMLTVRSEILESTMMLATKLVTAKESSQSSNQSSVAVSNERISNISSIQNNNNTSRRNAPVQKNKSVNLLENLRNAQTSASEANSITSLVENFHSLRNTPEPPTTFVRSPPRKRLCELLPNLTQNYDVIKAFPGSEVVLATASDDDEEIYENL